MQKNPISLARARQLFVQNSDKFEAFYSLLLHYNEKFNLTAITGREEVVHKHFLDSLAGESFFPQAADAVEIGSGAGFPSIPLKIVRPDLALTLVESTGKKCEFLRAAVRELGLDGVEIVNGRAEELGRGRLRERFSVAFARAVAPLPALAEYCLPLVKTGGRFLAYKGTGERAEEGAYAFRLLGGDAGESYPYDLEGYGARTLIVVTKTGRTPPKYPRGRGKERSDPLVAKENG